MPDKTLIEDRFRDALGRWIEHGIEPGHFLTAVLANDLKEAISRGDEDAIDNIPHIVAYLYNDAPSVCWGSYEKVRAWSGTFAARRGSRGTP
jgi:hypothetical protein